MLILFDFNRSNATKLLKEAEDVIDVLNKTQDAQKEAEVAIEKAWDDYKMVEDILYMVNKDVISYQS